MDLGTYLVKFFTYEFPRDLATVIYRSLVLLSQNFGLSVMVRSFFKPLFGFPGVFSRINGVVIRTLTITLSIVVLVLASVALLLGFIGVFALPAILIFKGYFAYAALIILVIVLLKVYSYYYHPISLIDNYLDLSQYHLAGDIYMRMLLSLAFESKFTDLVVSLSKKHETVNFFLRLELPAEQILNHLYSSAGKMDNQIFSASMLEINNEVKLKLVSHELILASLILAVEKHEPFLGKYSSTTEQVIGAVNQVRVLKNRHPQIWDKDFQIPPSGGIDKGWAVSYTANLNRYGEDYTKAALKGYMPKLIGRDDVKTQVVRVLSKGSKNNVMLVGRSGTGKTTFVKGLAREIALGTSLPALQYKRIISLNVAEIISGGTAETARRMSLLLREISASGNIILFIDDIHNLLNVDKSGSIIMEALNNSLSSGKFQFIGTTSRQEYEKYIATDQSFANSFDIVEMRESTKSETIEMMVHLVRGMESKGLIVSYPSLDLTYDLAKRYIYDRAFPDKGIQLLMNALSSLSPSTRVLDKNTVAEAISVALKVPAKSITEDEKDKLMQLEENLHLRVIGQDMAVTQISNALKRARVGVRAEGKPIASFLFFGPTGVGKTETAKALADLYFGSAEYMVRVDMSEFQTQDSINRLIGAGGNSVGTFTSQVKTHPYSLILLDEIEKADRNIFNLFLQVLDDGRLTDATGYTVNFENNLIIMTSNAGTMEMVKSLDQGATPEQAIAIGLESLKEFYPPEFLNRFSALIPFYPLTPEQMELIAHIKVNLVAQRLKEKHINLMFSKNLIKEIAAKGYSREWGARPLNRVIEQDLETRIANLIISGEIKPGDSYQLDTLE